MHIIINLWGTGRFLPLCMASLEMQTYRDWHAHITVDGGWSVDYDTLQYLRKLRSDDRVSVTMAPERRYVLANTYEAIQRTKAEPHDVIAILDGDDWLCRHDALALVAAAHDDGALVTYGSWVANKANYPSHPLTAYPDGANVREHDPWLATALRTFRRGLVDLIDYADLCDDAGEMFRTVPDWPIMIPALEMVGLENARHISQPIYFYNRDSGQSAMDLMKKEKDRNADLIRSRPSYDRLSRSELSALRGKR